MFIFRLIHSDMQINVKKNEAPCRQLIRRLMTLKTYEKKNKEVRK